MDWGPLQNRSQFYEPPKKAWRVLNLKGSSFDQGLKRSPTWLQKKRQPRDKEVDERLYEAFKKRREQKRVNWKLLKTLEKQAYEEVHGKPMEKPISGSVLSGFLDQREVVMLKKTNKKSRSIEERLPCIQDYHLHILSLRKSVRIDKPNQPRDPDGGRFAWADTYSLDEHPIELIRNAKQTYEQKYTDHVQVKQPKGSLDQRQCAVYLLFERSDLKTWSLC